jgi:hypothetical protein
MDSGLDARAYRVLDSIVRQMDRSNLMKIVVVHSGGKGRLGEISVQFLPQVGDKIIFKSGSSCIVIGRVFDFNLQEIRLLVNEA